jgi:hypothetical protein
VRLVWRWSVLLLPVYVIMSNHDYDNYKSYYLSNGYPYYTANYGYRYDEYPNVTYDKLYCLSNNFNNY